MEFVKNYQPEEVQRWVGLSWEKVNVHLRTWFNLTSAVEQIGCRNEAPCNVSDEPGPPVSDSLQGVDCILHEVSAIRHFLEKRERFRDIAKEWLEVGYVLDVLLYRVYLLVVTVYIIILSILWSVWQHS